MHWLRMAQKKAANSSCRYRVLAIGLSRKGDLVGCATNYPRYTDEGGSVHAEINLLRKFGPKIRKIILLRVGAKGDLLPIHPCETCAKVLEKEGIKVETVLD